MRLKETGGGDAIASDVTIEENGTLVIGTNNQIADAADRYIGRRYIRAQ